jgi:hypothetical protein
MWIVANQIMGSTSVTIVSLHDDEKSAIEAKGETELTMRLDRPTGLFRRSDNLPAPGDNVATWYNGDERRAMC